MVDYTAVHYNTAWIAHDSCNCEQAKVVVFLATPCATRLGQAGEFIKRQQSLSKAAREHIWWYQLFELRQPL
jgi:hypothetical protein